MSYLTRAVILLLFFGLSACAPVMLGRTPTPAPVGETKLSAGINYPVGLTQLPIPPGDGLFGESDPAYSPLPLPLSFRIAYGRSEVWETNLELMVSPSNPFLGLDDPFQFGLPNAGARYGAKNRFQTEPVELAFDFGASLYAPGITLGVDAGILAAVPLGDAKLYGGLRGFGVYEGQPNNLNGAVALTVGGEVPLEDTQSVLLELTLLVNGYNGARYVARNGLPPPPAPQPIGSTLVPAITFNF